MALYRFVGTTESGLMGSKPMKFVIFGQKAEIDSTVAEEQIADRFPLLSEAEWAKTGITDAELSDQAAKIVTSRATPAFMAKVEGAWGILGAYRTELRAARAVVEPQPQEEPAIQEQVKE